MPYVMLMGLDRVAIITVQPVGNLSNAELEAELRKRLESKSFSVERIKILEDNQARPNAGKLRIFPLESSKER